MQATSPAFGSTLAVRIAGKTRRWTHRFFDSYHPELHYMRGPGPKWREKQGLPPLDTAEASDFGFAPMRKIGA